MDIARTPSTPTAIPKWPTPHPSRGAAADPARGLRAVSLADPEIALAFDLGLERTRIRSTLTVQRNAKAPQSPAIRLNGDGLKPLEVIVDGQAINSWSLDGHDLIVPLTAIPTRSR
jgi:aminopeptidase N